MPDQETAAPLVSVQIVDQVAIVEINRPPVNALNAAVIVELAAALDRVDADPTVAAIVVRGGGERAFVAGADIAEFVGLGVDTGSAHVTGVQHVIRRVAICGKPVVAAIRGFCLGGGLELALGCDIRVAAEDAQLGLPEIKLGLLPGGGGTQRLRRVVGPGRARLLTLTGDPISAATAYDWGLVDRVVPVEQLEEAVLDLGRTFAERSAHALAELKALFNATEDAPIADGLPLEAAAFGRCVASPDGREGVAAFLEKRAAVWQSRSES
jgi:enoyl-CoA hydratase/carnithine racemase